MSLLILQSPLFSLFIFFLIVVVFTKISKARSGWGSKCPPGPWKLPIIGNLHQLATGNPLPHHALRDLARKHGPIMHLKLGQLQAIVISSPKAAEEVFRTHDVSFAQRPQVLAVQVMSYGQGSVVFAPYGVFWKEMRKVCVFNLLNPKRVQSSGSIRREEVSNLIQSISSSSTKGLLTPINLSEKIFSMTNAIVSRVAFGKKCKDQKEFTSLLQEANKLAAGFGIPDLFPSIRFVGFITGTIPAMKKMQKELGNFLDRIIDDHKTNEQDKSEEDFVDVLLKLHDQSKDLDLTMDQIKDVILDMFGGGSETTATTIEWAMSELLRNPRTMDKAQNEVRNLLKGKPNVEEEDIQTLDYLKAVVKETLRLHPPAPLLPRESIERCEFAGYEFPKKIKVISNVWALGRDPESWTDAESFKPERFLLHGCDSNVDWDGWNFEFIPFGSGRRMCPGIPFGIRMIHLALSQLLYHFTWKLGDEIEPEKLDMSETFGITCRRRHDLYVTANPALIVS